MVLRQRAVERENARGITLLVISVLALLLSTLAVICRMLARRLKRTPLASDDLFIIVALIGGYGNGIAEIVGVSLGAIGPHRRDITYSQFLQATKTLLVAEISWAVSLWALKVSLLLFYLRIFPLRIFRLAAYTLLVVVTSYFVGCILFFTLDCKPITGPTCSNQNTGWASTGALNLATDFVVLSLPIPVVWNLQLPKMTKIGLTVVFGIGFLVCIISILRIVAVLNLDTADLTYTAVPAHIYSVLEPTLGIISACLAIMRPLFEKILPKQFLKSSVRSISKQHKVKETTTAKKNGTMLGIPMKDYFNSRPSVDVGGERGREKSLNDFHRLDDEISAIESTPRLPRQQEEVRAAEADPYPLPSVSAMSPDTRSIEDSSSVDARSQDGRPLVPAIFDGTGYSVNITAEQPTHRHHLEMAYDDSESRRGQGSGIRVKQEWEIR